MNPFSTVEIDEPAGDAASSDWRGNRRRITFWILRAAYIKLKFVLLYRDVSVTDWIDEHAEEDMKRHGITLPENAVPPAEPPQDAR